MKLIEQSRALNPRRVRMFLAEKGITVPLEQVDVMKQEHRSAEFTQLNPLQQLPVLILDDGTAISESIAICRYFEETSPTPPLFGTGPLERALVEMWNRRVELSLLMNIANAFRHGHQAMAALEKPQVPAYAEVCKTKAADFLRILDTQLANHEFIAGRNFSVADISAVVAMDFMRPARIDRPAGLANLDRWYAAVSARPSAKA